MSGISRIDRWRKKEKEKRKMKNRNYYKKNRQNEENSVRERYMFIENRRRKNREYVKKFRTKTTQSVGPGGDAGDYPNRMSKHRAMKRFKEALPSDESKRTSLLTDYLTGSGSPSVKNALKTITQKITLAGDAVLNDINNTVKQMKYKRNECARTVVNIIAASVNGEVTSTRKSKTAVARRLGLPLKRLGKRNQSKRLRTEVFHTETSAIQFTQRKTRKDKIDESTRKLAYDFWLKPDISRPTGNKSDVKRVRIGPKMYTSHMIHILEKSQHEVFELFKIEHPDVKIGLRRFESCKPYFVRQARQKDRTTCCCRYHVEAQSIFKTAMEFRRNATHGDVPVYDHLDDMVSTTLCHTDSRTLKCYERKCEDCGVHMLQLLNEERPTSDTAPDVNWEMYEYKDMKCKLAKLKNLKDNLPMNHVICIHDYSENYRCREKSEIQADYFQRTEVSLHVTLIHRHALIGVDGVESKEEYPVIITEQFFTVSDDLQHDQYFTHEVQRQISEYLSNISYKTSVMHEWTDVCPQQYKSRHCFGDLSVSARHLGYDVLLRNYFETSHGKGPHDATGGYVKAQADLAVTRGQILIQNAQDLYLFGTNKLESVSKQNGCKRRIFVHTETIPRNGKSRFKSVHNIRSIHQLITIGSGNLKAKRLSCYSCDSCMDTEYDFCQNTNMTGQFRLLTMESEDGTIDEEDGDDMDAICTTLKHQVKENTVVAVLADDEERSYYLFKSKGPFEVLENDKTDDFGAPHYAGSEIIRGLYFDTVKTNPLKYRIIPNKLAIVPAVSVKYIFTGVNGASCKRLNIDASTHCCILGRLRK